MDDSRDDQHEHGKAVECADGQGDATAFLDSEEKQARKCCKNDDCQDEFGEGKRSLAADVLVNSYQIRDEPHPPVTRLRSPRPL